MVVCPLFRKSVGPEYHGGFLRAACRRAFPVLAVDGVPGSAPEVAGVASACGRFIGHCMIPAHAPAGIQGSRFVHSAVDPERSSCRRHEAARGGSTHHGQARRLHSCSARVRSGRLGTAHLPGNVRSGIRVPAGRELIRRACERAGRSRQDPAGKLEKSDQRESVASGPVPKQLEDSAHTVHAGFDFLLLPRPPDELRTLLDCRIRQDRYRDHLMDDRAKEDRSGTSGSVSEAGSLRRKSRWSAHCPCRGLWRRRRCRRGSGSETRAPRDSGYPIENECEVHEVQRGAEPRAGSLCSGRTPVGAMGSPEGISHDREGR